MGSTKITLYKFTQFLIADKYEDSLRILQDTSGSNVSSIYPSYSGAYENKSPECHNFSTRIVRHNSLTCKLVISSEDDQSDLRELLCQEIILIQGLPPTINDVCLEILIAYNYVVLIFSMSQFTKKLMAEAWQTVSTTLARVSHLSHGNIFYFVDPTIDSRLFFQNTNFNTLTVLSLELLSNFCFAKAWSAAIDSKYETFSKLTKSIKAMKMVIDQKISSESEWSAESFDKFSFWPTHCAPSVSDLYNFLTAIKKLKNKALEEAVYYIRKIKFQDWNYELRYFSSCILYHMSKYDVVLDDCMRSWEEKMYLKKNLIAKFCNLAGCCFYSQSKFSESEVWLKRSLEYDSDFSLPKWNLSLLFENLNHPYKAKGCLNSLIELSLNRSSAQWCVFNCLSLSKPQITHDKAMYASAHHLFEVESYLESSDRFAELISHCRKNLMLNQPAFFFQGISPDSEYKIYVEAAYVFLLSKKFGKCSKVCALIDQMMPLTCDFNFQNFFAGSQKKSVEATKLDTSLFTNLFQGYSIKLVGPEYRLDCVNFEKLYISIVKVHVVTCLLFHKKEYQPIILILRKLVCICMGMYRKNIESFKKLSCFENSSWVTQNCIEVSNEQTQSISKRLKLLTTREEDERNRSKGSNNVKTASSINSCDTKLSQYVLKDKNILSMVYNNLAVILIAHGHLGDAKINLQLAGENCPENLDVLYNSCLLEIKLGNVSVAQKMWYSAKQKLKILKQLLAGSTQSHPYTVDVNCLRSLDSAIEVLFNDAHFKLDFDVTWGPDDIF